MPASGATSKRGAGLEVLLLFGGLLGPLAQAQSCHPLEGSWRLSVRASQMGPSLSFNPYYTVRAVRLRLRTMAGRIDERWSFNGRHLHETWSYSFRPDGRPQPTDTRSVLYSVPTSVVARWQNCTLLVDGLSSLFGLQISTLNTYVFSPDGRTLTILQASESPIMHVSRKLVFRRVRAAETAARGH